MADPITDRARDIPTASSTWSIVFSVLMIAAGVLAIWKPPIAGITITAIVGWLLIFSGALHLAYASRYSTGTELLEVLLGIVYALAGFWLLTRPVLGLASLTLVLVVYLLVEAVLEFILAYRHRGTWRTGWLVFDGIVTLVLAVLVWLAWPSSTAWAIGTLVGISMLISGIARLALAVGGHQVVSVLSDASYRGPRGRAVL
jgi:uncharacterized membrane protein HdeD (DUF308 family)